jgi:hypothetical protein
MKKEEEKKKGCTIEQKKSATTKPIQGILVTTNEAKSYIDTIRHKAYSSNMTMKPDKPTVKFSSQHCRCAGCGTKMDYMQAVCTECFLPNFESNSTLTLTDNVSTEEGSLY